MNIVADDKIPFLSGILESKAGIRFLPGNRIGTDAVREADALLIRTRTICDRHLLAGSRVRFIATATIGFDHIDTEWCEQNGIFWTNSPGCNSSSVAQYVCSALLNQAVLRENSLSGKTLGVIGVGNVGSKVAAVGRALGMRVLLNDPPRARAEGSNAFVPLPDLLANADYVTLHVPLENDGPDLTFHLADSKFFRQMKPGSVFLNSSRGEVTDTAALKDAVRDGHLADTVIDVWEEEPDIDRELLALATYATPHIAGYSLDGKANGTSMVVQALSRHFNLGLESWYPTGLPLPPNAGIILETDNKTIETALAEAVNTAYRVRDDDRRLREHPETFEKQRGDYPLRREFPAFSVKVSGSNPDKRQRIESILKQLGFQIAACT